MTYALFDFDETLVAENSLSFLFRQITHTRCLACHALPVLFSKMFWQQGVRYAIKRRLYRHCLTGCTDAQLYQAGQRVAQRLTLNVEVVQRLHEHHQQGHVIGVVTASPEPFIKGVVAQLGWPCEWVIGTLLPSVSGCFTGALDAECVYEAKVARLEHALEGDLQAIAYAYGNLPADGPMLALAQEGFVVTNGNISTFSG